MKCYSCGAELAETAKFCGFCGAAQTQPFPEASQVPVEIVENDPPLSDALEALTAEEIADPVPAPEQEAEADAAPEAAHTAECEPDLFAAVQPMAPTQQDFQSPYQPGYRPNPYQPAYQPQQYIPFDIHSAMPQRPAEPAFQPVRQPAYQMPCQRSLPKMLLLSLLTLGIYRRVIYARISEEINMVASRHDGKRTMPFLFVCMLAPLTLMIYPFVWIHGLCNRMGDELQRRQIHYKFSAASFWLWNLVYGFVGGLITGIAVSVLYCLVESKMILVILIGSLLLLASMVGPCMFIHKMMKAMNLINTDYNRRG